MHWEARVEPADVAVLRNALEDTNPTPAALGALVAFHSLQAADLRHLLLTASATAASPRPTNHAARRAGARPYSRLP
ncbi:hypothetical protein ACGFSD_07255 [Streptomyces caniferus]|uniref:hypothetical protein n=1 Tax=Streptomyces caniferus TaxID=285557 RepID=UPI00371B2966